MNLRLPLYIIVSFFCSLISTWFFETYYIGGDYALYSEAYENVSLYSPDGLIGSFLYYRKLTGGSDFIHFIFVYIFSGVIDHSSFVFLSNFLLLTAFSLYNLKYKINFLYFLFGIVFNYYIFVIMGPAERLKYAVLFAALFATFNLKSYALLSIFSHLSSFTLNLSIGLRDFLLKRHFIFSFSFFLTIVLFGLFLYPYFSYKIAKYTSGGFEFPVIFLSIVMYSFFLIRKISFLLPLLFFSPFVFVLGEWRLLILLYFFIYLSIHIYKKNLYFIFLTSGLFLYFNLRSFDFVYNVIENGHAFGQAPYLIFFRFIGFT